VAKNNGDNHNVKNKGQNKIDMENEWASTLGSTARSNKAGIASTMAR